jgi:hypothetical protein
VLAYGCAITPEGVRLARRVILRLPPLGSRNG